MVSKIFAVKQAKNVFFKGRMMPVYINLYITSRCNLKCRHCYFHESLNRPEEISLENIEKLSKSSGEIVNIALTGGEPFLRQDIAKIAGLFVKNSNARIVTIPTNGMLSKVIEEQAGKMLRENPKAIFNVFVSLDGEEKTHNRIRGDKNAFSNAMKTLSGLENLRKKFDNLRLGIIFTMNETNAEQALPLYKKISKNLGIDQFQINFLRGSPKSIRVSDRIIGEYEKANAEIQKDFESGKYSGYKIMGDFYTCINRRYKEVLAKTVKEKKFQLPCYAGTTNIIIYPNADVFACEMRDDLKFGNLGDYGFDLKKMTEEKKNKELVEKIRKSNCFCTFECQLTSNVAYNPKELLKAGSLFLKLKMGGK